MAIPDSLIKEHRSMQKAWLVRKEEGDVVVCEACKFYCKLKPGRVGICGVRVNHQGELLLLVYGKASAVQIDPIEKKPLYHFLPGTNIFSLGTVGCNFGCTFCQNYNISQVTRKLRKQILKNKLPGGIELEVSKFGYELSPEKIVDICEQQNIPAIAYTYNEPIIFFEYLYDTSVLANEKGINNVFVSNGYESKEALEKMAPYLHAMNIDLKSFNEKFYTQICQAKLEPVLETIRHAHDLGIWLEITTLVIPGKNDSEQELTQIAEFIASIDPDIPWHISAFHPNYQMLESPATSSQTLRRAYILGKNAGLNYVYLGNIRDEKKDLVHIARDVENCLFKDRATTLSFYLGSQKVNVIIAKLK